jgi:hypothetical protein
MERQKKSVEGKDTEVSWEKASAKGSKTKKTSKNSKTGESPACATKKNAARFSAAKSSEKKSSQSGGKEFSRSKTSESKPPAFYHGFELFKPSWAALRFNFDTIVRLLVLPISAGIAAIILLGIGEHQYGQAREVSYGIAAFVGLVGILLTLFIFPAIYHVEIASARKEKTDYHEALSRAKKTVWRYYGVSILSSILVLLGTLLFIIPGLFMIRRYMLAPLYVVDCDYGVLQAMKQSATDSKTYALSIWQIIGVKILISLVSVLPIIGWFLSLIGDIGYAFAPAVRYTEITDAEKAAN